MDIKINYDSIPEPNAVPEGLVLELRDGTDAFIACSCGMKLPEKDGRAGFVCYNVQLGSVHGHACRPADPDDLQGAKVLDIKTQGGILKNVQVSTFRPAYPVMLPLDMYTRDFPSDIPWADIDRPCRPIVRYFNLNNMPTAMCCSGHPGTHQKRFWVEFKNGVSEQDILHFMAAHTLKNNAFVSRGMFCTRYDMAQDPGGSLAKAFQYTAVDIYDAMADLADWSADDMYGKPGHGARPQSKGAAGLTERLVYRYGPYVPEKKEGADNA